MYILCSFYRSATFSIFFRRFGFVTHPKAVDREFRSVAFQFGVAQWTWIWSKLWTIYIYIYIIMCGKNSDDAIIIYIIGFKNPDGNSNPRKQIDHDLIIDLKTPQSQSTGHPAIVFAACHLSKHSWRLLSLMYHIACDSTNSDWVSNASLTDSILQKPSVTPPLLFTLEYHKRNLLLNDSIDLSIGQKILFLHEHWSCSHSCRLPCRCRSCLPWVKDSVYQIGKHWKNLLGPDTTPMLERSGLGALMVQLLSNGEAGLWLEILGTWILRMIPLTSFWKILKNKVLIVNLGKFSHIILKSECNSMGLKTMGSNSKSGVSIVFTVLMITCCLFFLRFLWRRIVGVIHRLYIILWRLFRFIFQGLCWLGLGICRICLCLNTVCYRRFFLLSNSFASTSTSASPFSSATPSCWFLHYIITFWTFWWIFSAFFWLPPTASSFA